MQPCSRVSRSRRRGLLRADGAAVDFDFERRAELLFEEGLNHTRARVGRSRTARTRACEPERDDRVGHVDEFDAAAIRLNHGTDNLVDKRFDSLSHLAKVSETGAISLTKIGWRGISGRHTSTHA